MIELILQRLTIEKPPPSSDQGREEVKSQITAFLLSFKHSLNHNQARFFKWRYNFLWALNPIPLFDISYIIFAEGKKTYFKSELQTIPLTAVKWALPPEKVGLTHNESLVCLVSLE